MKSIIIILLFIGLHGSVMAQWSGTGTNLYVNGGTNRIGIGTNAPSTELDINGSLLMRNSNLTTQGLALSGGLMSLRGWGANNPYIEWRNNGASGTRQGYMGWNTDRLSLVLENSFNFSVEGGRTSLGSEAYPRAWLHVFGTRLASTSDLNEEQVLLASRRGVYGTGQQEVNMGLFLSKYSAADANSYSRAEFRLSYQGTAGNNWGETLLQGHTVMTLLGNGNVGIGTRNPASKLEVNGNVNVTNGTMAIGAVSIGTLKLAVEGKVGAREVIVTAGAWPDYVFADNYNLPTLESVKSFIKENHRLPDVPSEQKVKEDGVPLGEMNELMLKKIEELTLYVIDQNEKIKKLESIVTELKADKKN